MPIKKKASAHAAHKEHKKIEHHTHVVVHEQESAEVPQKKENRPVMQVVEVTDEQTPVQKEQSVAAVYVEPTQIEKPAEAEKITPTETMNSVVSPMPSVSATIIPPDSSIANPPPSGPSVPTPNEAFTEELPAEKKSRSGIIVLLVLLLLIFSGAVGGYIYFKKGASFPVALSSLVGSKPKPIVKVSVTPTQSITPTLTPVVVDKSKYTIQILNGSGVRGSAGKLKDALITAGFSVVTTGNANTADYKKTQISAKKTVDTGFLSALSLEVSKLYGVDPTPVVLSTGSSDVVITIGSGTAQ